ncbi:MAG TPA: polyribonucleotide nucleotidyltransferase [Spirochaetia bacterium]|nr:polyribonucleotide nucleotidyltransferase [Spirochaetia bacterium]
MHRVSLDINGTELVLETGKMAKQANGAVFATYGGGAVLATACCGSEPVVGLDYVPLQVEYNEKYYAAGKIPGGFMKREGRPKDREILVCRLIDRPMRPLFDKRFGRDIQVVPTVVGTDNINMPDVLAMNAASAAVTISDIPFDGPIGAVRVGYVNNEFIINPTYEQLATSDLDIIVAGTQDGITMVEGGAEQVSEQVLIDAIEKARPMIIELCRIQVELRLAVGKDKLPIPEVEDTFAPADEIRSFAYPKLEEACFVKGKFERYAAIKAVKNEAKEKFAEAIGDEGGKAFSALFEDMEQEIVRKSILEKKVRTDGRGPEDIRPISAEVSLLERTHGSALFTRGETQALAVVTLGTKRDAQIIDNIEEDGVSKFLLHYNFPPFSVGETGRMGTGRREIGHGHLAHRALEAVLPEQASFPYTLRVVSEILESNGSSSMATVCGGTLSLMDAGVPIAKPVAGIAMGLVTDGQDYVVLSDILGEEDHLGDMDFKVAGTSEGITAFQMDIKIKNIAPEVMKIALEQALKGRQHILGKMDEALTAPREELSRYAPRIIGFSVDPEKIGTLIGPGGKTIKSVSEKHDVQINIENDGSVTVYCKDADAAEAAKASLLRLLEEPEVGRTYDAVVRRLVDFGAFVEYLPGREGLVHISKMAPFRVEKVSDVLQMNQEVPVRIIEIDKMGRVNLSLIYDEKEGGDRGGERRDRDDRGSRDRGSRDRGSRND